MTVMLNGLPAVTAVGPLTANWVAAPAAATGSKNSPLMIPLGPACRVILMITLPVTFH